jgi:hypothetical protein
MPPSDTQIQLSFQVCPIILSGGIVAQIPGALLPMTKIFDPNLYAFNNLALPYPIYDLDDAFGSFNVLPGGTLVSQSIGKYPFANQSVAANAVIREPLTLSLIMDAPMRGPKAFAIKHMIMHCLKATLEAHNNAGGVYVIATPAFMYDNMVMISLTDNSRGTNSLPQNAWRFDFEKPLVALADLDVAYNEMMAKIANNLPTSANLTGIQVGSPAAQSPLALFGPGTPQPGGVIAGGTPTPLAASFKEAIANYHAMAPLAGFSTAGIA